MTDEFGALYYTCSLIEFTARQTNNFPDAVVRQAGRENIRHFLDLADVYHCLTFEQSCDEFIERMGGLPKGKRDMSRYTTIPSVTSIGKDYAYLIDELADDTAIDPAQGKTAAYLTLIMEVFDSFFSRAVSDFNSSFFYENLSYHLACWKAKAILP